ncbi:MAG: Inner rane component of periplasmic domain [Hyphomicrobiales bacterium]|nr:Inner rane component of periplasmic domain [Hyphomicrobiales bacterium]
MSFSIEIYENKKLISTHVVRDARFTVGSDLECDLIVSTAPKHWFTCTYDLTTEDLKTLPESPLCRMNGKANGNGQGSAGKAEIGMDGHNLRAIVKPVSIKSAALRATALRAISGVDLTLRKFGAGLTGVRGMSSRKLGFTGCALAICVSVAALLNGSISVPASTKRETSALNTRGMASDTSRAAPLEYRSPLREGTGESRSVAAQAGRTLHERFTRTGLGDKVQITQEGSQLSISGVVSPQELLTVRELVDDLKKSTGVKIDNLSQTKSTLPKYQVGAFGLSPQFIVLADGRRAFPGDLLPGGWQLLLVGSHEIEIERSGQKAKVAF